ADHRLLNSFPTRRSSDLSCIVAAESITAAMTRQAAEQPVSFRQFVQAQIEKPRPLPIDQGHTHSRLRSQKRRQRLEMKAPVNERSEEHTSELQSRGHLVC